MLKFLTYYSCKLFCFPLFTLGQLDTCMTYAWLSCPIAYSMFFRQINRWWWNIWGNGNLLWDGASTCTIFIFCYATVGLVSTLVICSGSITKLITHVFYNLYEIWLHHRKGSVFFHKKGYTKQRHKKSPNNTVEKNNAKHKRLNMILHFLTESTVYMETKSYDVTGYYDVMKHTDTILLYTVNKILYQSVDNCSFTENFLHQGMMITKDNWSK